MLSEDPTIPPEGVIRLLEDPTSSPKGPIWLSEDPTSPTSQSLLALQRALSSYQALRGPYQPSRVQVTL